METRIGKNGWILCRLNRGYDNPYPESDMDVILEPYAFADVVPWETACANVAQDIYKQYKGKDLYVAMSGGIDGECVANSFYNANIPFTPIIFKIGTLHDVDVWWAERWCKERNITPVIVDNVLLRDYAIRIVQINQQYCTRTASGPALFDYLKKYVEERNGVIVSGAGFAEYFPDENLEYMRSGQRKPIYDDAGDYSDYQRWWDNKLVNAQRETINEGFLFHEPDIINAFILEGHPWNFLSWTPEIMLSYICARDYTLTSADDKARIMKCAPRPKVAGLWEYVYQTWPILKRWGYIRPGIGQSECDFLGTVDELKRKLGNI